MLRTSSRRGDKKGTFRIQLGNTETWTDSAQSEDAATLVCSQIECALLSALVSSSVTARRKRPQAEHWGSLIGGAVVPATKH